MSAGDRDTLTDDERLEALKAWQDTWKDKGYPYPVPTASFLAGFDAAAARVRTAQAQALRDAADALDHDPKYHDGTSIITGWLRENADRLEPGDEFQR